MDFKFSEFVTVRWCFCGLECIRLQIGIIYFKKKNYQYPIYILEKHESDYTVMFLHVVNHISQCSVINTLKGF